jgi:hypothetical protein
MLNVMGQFQKKFPAQTQRRNAKGLNDALSSRAVLCALAGDF